MNIRLEKHVFVAAAILAAAALFATGFFVALGVRSVVAGGTAAPPAQEPTVSHTHDQIELPAGTWSGLDADTLDGLNSDQIDDGDDHVSEADHAASADSATSASSANYATQAGSANTANSATTASYATTAGTAGTAYDADTADYATDADTVDGHHYDEIQDADDYVSWAHECNIAYVAHYAWDADEVDGKHASELEERCILCYGSCGNGFNNYGGTLGAWGGGGGAYWYCDLNDYRNDPVPAGFNTKYLCCQG